MQHILADFASFFSTRILIRGAPAQSRAPCPGLHLLGTVRGHAVLSVGTRPVASRNLRRAGCFGREVKTLRITGSASAFDPTPCQLTPALAAVPNRIRATAAEVQTGRGSAAGEEEEEIPLQEQTPQPGCHGDRPVRVGG